jgi:hypothetical protein
MEGYSVTEAASVLGVPIERIWELLARGVLSGAPEGETGMRVFLQPRPAPAPPEPHGPNGHSGEPERELSPFRELLTEFRNLTERYGQALLALGESRGEVAALRSRVDLLEARMDLSLPGGSSWAPPPAFPVEHAVIPTAPEPAPPVPSRRDVEAAEAREEEQRHRARGPRRATDSFAEALARAEDPSPPELPHTLDAGGSRVQRETDETALPRVAPAAEAVLLADEVADVAAAGAEPAQVTDIPIAQPEPIAEPMLETDASELEPSTADAGLVESWSWADADEAEGEGDEELEARTAVEVSEPLPEPDVGKAATLEPAGPSWDALEERADGADAADPGFTLDEPSPAIESPGPATEDDGIDAESVEVVPIGAASPPEPAPDEEPPADAAEDAVSAAEQEASDVPEVEAAPLDWDADRYTALIDEPDWFEAEVEAVPRAAAEPGLGAAEPQPAPVAAEPQPAVVAAEPEPVAEPERVAEAEPDEASDVMSGTAAYEPRVSAAGEAQPAAHADLAAAKAIVQPSSPAREPTESATLPGSVELDRALDTLRRQAMDASDEADEWPPTPPTAGTGATSSFPASPSLRPAPPRPGRPPVTPAGRAYRRLRRIFPG